MTFRFLAALALSLFMAFAAAAQDAGRELHIIVAQQGKIRTDGRIHGPQVDVTVVRPGQKVILAFNPRSPIRFMVTLDDETEIEQVYLFGRAAARSEVFVNGEEHPVLALQNVQDISRDVGFAFREALKSLTGTANIDRVASVTVADRRNDVPLGVAKVVDKPHYRQTYLQDLVQPDRLSETLKAHLDGTAMTPGVQLTQDGFTLVENAMTMDFPITLDVPPISHAVAAAYDPTAKRLYGVTLGGEGFLYAYDIEADQWSVLSSMGNEDATGLIFDEERNRLIIAVNRARDGHGNLREWTEERGLQPFTIGVKVSDMPGLTDLFEPGRNGGGQMPGMLLLAIDGNDLLVRNIPARYARRPDRAPPVSRTYVIDMETAETALVAYVGD